MDIIFIVIGLLLIIIASFYWGNVLALRLPEINKIFDRKPFNCRPCFTFHMVWSLSAIVALVSECYIIACCGVITAFILFFIVKYIDNKKIIK